MTRGLIHRVTVKNPTGITTDAEGVATTTYESFTVEGRCELTTATIETPVQGADNTANVPGSSTEAVCLIPVGVTVAAGAVVVVSGTKHRMADGQWDIVSVRHTRLHQRLGLVRRGF